MDFNDNKFTHSYEIDSDFCGFTNLELDNMVSISPSGKDIGTFIEITCVPKFSCKWIGKIREGDYDFTACFACPNPNDCLVVAGGDGYIINVNDPSRPILIPCDPIIAVNAAPESGILLVNSFTDMVAIDSSGVKWTARCVFGDELNFVKADCTTVVVRGWVGGEPELVFKKLSLATGRYCD